MKLRECAHCLGQSIVYEEPDGEEYAMPLVMCRKCGMNCSSIEVWNRRDGEMELAKAAFLAGCEAGQDEAVAVHGGLQVPPDYREDEFEKWWEARK